MEATPTSETPASSQAIVNVQQEYAKLSSALRLSALINNIQASIAKVYKLMAVSNDSRFSSLVMSYSNLLDRASILLSGVENGDNINAIIAELSVLESNFSTDKFKEEAAREQIPQQNFPILPGEPLEQVFNYFALMGDLITLQQQNRYMQSELRLLSLGYRHFNTTLLVANILSCEAENIGDIAARDQLVAKALDDVKQEMESELKQEVTEMIDAGTPPQQVREHYNRFHTFINNRIQSISDSAHDIAGKMRAGQYGQVKDAIVGAYNRYITPHAMELQVRAREYGETLNKHRQAINAHLHRNAATVYSNTVQLWTDSSGRATELAGNLGSRFGNLRASIEQTDIRGLFDLRRIMRISNAASAGINETMADFSRMLIEDDRNITNNLANITARLQEYFGPHRETMSDLLAGRSNNIEDVNEIARFLSAKQEINAGMLLEKINAHRKEHGIPQIGSWQTKINDAKNTAFNTVHSIFHH